MKRRSRSPGPRSVHPLVLSLALLVVGCTSGGSTQASSPSPTPADAAETPAATPTTPEPTATIDPATEEWIAAVSDACKAYTKTLGKGGFKGYYQRQDEEMNAWIEALREAGPTPQEYRSDVDDVMDLFREAIAANRRALLADQKFSATVVFPSEAAADAAVEAVESTSKEAAKAFSPATRALNRLSRSAGLDCA